MKSKKLWRKVWVLPVFVFALVAGLFLVTGSASAAAGLNFDTPSSFYSDSAENFDVCTLDDSHIAVAYRDNAGSGDGYVKIGTDTGSTITWSAAGQFESDAVDDVAIECLSSTNFVVAYENVPLSKSHAKVGTVTGSWTVDGAGWGSPTQFFEDDPNYVSIDSLSSGKIAISWSNGFTEHGGVIAGTISGTTITFGSGITYNGASGSEHGVITALDTDKFAIAYADKNNSSAGTAIVGTVSGLTTIAMGTARQFDFGVGADSDLSIDKLSDHKFVVGWHDDINHGLAIIGNVSGTNTLSFGSSKKVADNPVNPAVVAIDSSHFVVAYEDFNNSQYGTSRVGNVNGIEITSFGSTTVFDTVNTIAFEMAKLDGSNIVTIYQNQTDSASYATVGTNTPKTYDLANIRVFVYDPPLNKILGLSVSNWGIDVHIEDPDGTFTEHHIIPNGGNNLSLSNTNIVSTGANTIGFSYILNSTPSTRQVEYNYSTNTVVSDIALDTDTYQHMAASILGYNSKPIIFYVESDGTLVVKVDGSTHTFTTDVAPIDAPMAVAYNSATEQIRFVYHDIDYKIREGGFDKDGPYTMTTTEVVDLTEPASLIRLPGVNSNDKAIVAYARGNDDNLKIASNPSGTWNDYAISANNSLNDGTSFDVILDPDNPTTNVIFLYNDGSDLISNNAVIASGASVATVQAAGTNTLRPALGDSDAGLQLVYYAQDQTVDTLYSFTEGAGVPIEMDQQEEGGPAVPELPTNIIWKIVIALMAMGAVIGIAAIFRKRGVKEAQDIVAGKKAVKKTTTKKKKK